MKLSVLDRVILLGLLPKEGDVLTLRIIRKLQEDLSFTEQEHALLKFKEENGRVSWSPEGNVDTDIEIGAKAATIISDLLTKLSAEKKLAAHHLDLYDKFVED